MRLLLHLKHPSLTKEGVEDIMEYALDIYEQPEKKNVTHCFEASKGEDVCEFEQTLCCRTCGNSDLEEREMFVGEPLIWPAWKTEPSEEDIMVGYVCETCCRLTMASEAYHCAKCGLTLFLEDMDDEIFGNS